MVSLQALKQRFTDFLEDGVERLENLAPPAGKFPLPNFDDFSFTADLNWTPPWDCENNPNSPLCGGKPWSIPLGFNFDFDQDECNTSFELDTTIFSSQGPRFQVSYRNPACVVEQPFPIIPESKSETEDEKDEDEDKDKPKPRLILPLPKEKKQDLPEYGPCENKCAPLFARFLEIRRSRIEAIEYNNRRSIQSLEARKERIFTPPNAPGKGQQYCDDQAAYYWDRYLSGRGSEFISPQYWAEAELDKEGFNHTYSRFYRIYENYAGEIELGSAFRKDGHWQEQTSSVFRTSRKLPDCSCIIRESNNSKKTYYGRYVTNQCYVISDFPPHGRVFGGADLYLETYIEKFNYEFYVALSSDSDTPLLSSAPFPEPPPKPPPPPFNRCKKKCDCTKDLSPVMTGILAQLNQIKERLQEE